MQKFKNILVEDNFVMQDLVIDRIYEGGRKGNAGDDPLGKLVGVSNSGGFRILGTKDNPKLIVLTTGMSDPDWPDDLQHALGQFTYYGDNKTPGNELHETNRYGNSLLRLIFDRLHSSPPKRDTIPPILIFANTGDYRDVRFMGLAVPGATSVPATDDLVAVWKTSRGKRFQNYRAIFTILDSAVLSASWISDIVHGNMNSPFEPAALADWRSSGNYRALTAEPTIEYRAKSEQLPTKRNHKALINALTNRFKLEPTRFEKCAAEIARMYLKNVTSLETTRASRDGGRDGIGKFQIGNQRSGIEIDFALEAKCYDAKSSVGVKDVSRLISRLRFRQFGVLVTTSFVGLQAYKEIKEDQHPIVILSGSDVAQCLEQHGLGNLTDLRVWLSSF